MFTNRASARGVQCALDTVSAWAQPGASRASTLRGLGAGMVIGPFGMILGVVTALDVVRALAAGLPLAPDAEVVFDRMAS